jgi:alanine dehydrogenase
MVYCYLQSKMKLISALLRKSAVRLCLFIAQLNEEPARLIIVFQEALPAQYLSLNRTAYFQFSLFIACSFKNAVSSSDVLLGKVKAGQNVVVIGGGLVGCETAAYVKETSSQVTIIEMLDDILLVANHCRNNDQNLRDMLAERKIAIAAPAKVKKYPRKT